MCSFANNNSFHIIFHFHIREERATCEDMKDAHTKKCARLSLISENWDNRFHCLQCALPTFDTGKSCT